MLTSKIDDLIVVLEVFGSSVDRLPYIENPPHILVGMRHVPLKKLSTAVQSVYG